MNNINKYIYIYITLQQGSDFGIDVTPYLCDVARAELSIYTLS